MKRIRRGPPAWIDPTVLYSRQEIAERTGLSDDVLSFWLKRRLLVPEPQEGSGKGVHHRFHYSQIGIAVVLKALRDHFGANIGALKSLADRLQGGVSLFRSANAPVDDWGWATRLADNLAKFREGEAVPVLDFDAGPGQTHRDAESEADLVAHSLQMSDGDPTAVIRLAGKLGPGKSTDYEIALALLGLPLNPRYMGNNYWLLTNKDGEWVIHPDTDEGSMDRSDVGPAMFLPVYRMLRKAWKIPRDLRRWDNVARLRAAMKDAGVEAEVYRSDGEYPDVRPARDEDWSKAQYIVNNFYKPDWMKERDGDDYSAYRSPDDYEDIYWTPERNAAEIAHIKDDLVALDREEFARSEGKK